jgi:hypothetical protein
MITILGAWMSFWFFNYESRYRAKLKEKNT